MLGPGSLLTRKMPRTHVSTTELLDEVYTPRLPVAARYRHYFEPTNVIDRGGELNPQLEEDLMAERGRYAPRSSFIKVSQA